MTARNVRNNNPLNIKHSTDEWRGQLPVQSDPTFVQFTDPKWGFRAAGRILKTYRDKYGLNNISNIINRWAPPSENDTASYVNFVVGKTGIPAWAELTEEDWPSLLQAMAKMEGGPEYDIATIKQGLALV